MPRTVRSTSSGSDLAGPTGPKVYAVATVDNTRKDEVIKCL